MLRSILFVGLCCAGLLNAQDSEDLEVQPYLLRIERLVDEELANEKDSQREKLLKLQHEQASGMERVNLSLALYTYYIFKSSEVAECYNNEAFDLASKLDFEEGILRSLYNKAYLLFITGDFDMALEKIRLIQSDRAIRKYPEIQADCETLKSYRYTERGEYDLALETSINLLEWAERLNHPYLLMRAYSAISHFYLRKGELNKSRNYCLKGIDYIIQLKKTHYIFPKIDELARTTHALEGSKKALDIYDFYLRMEKKISKPSDFIQCVVYMNIADIHIQERNLAKADNYLDRSLQLIAANNDRFRKPHAYALKGELCLVKKDTLMAIANYENALDAANDIDAFAVVKNTSGILASLYRGIGEDEKAFTYNRLHNEVSDSWFSQEANQKVVILEAKRDISEISRQKEVLLLQNQAHKERYRLTLVILAIISLSGGIATYSYVKVKRKNRLLYYRTKELAFATLHIDAGRETLDKVPVTTNSGEGDIAQETVINDDVKDIILAKLKNQEAEHFYLDPNCTLHQLSDKLQTNQKYLSQVINQEKKSNFNNYINELRINHLLKRLVEDKELRNSKLSYIAVKSGYNNLNTFNTAFKKRLGILPSYFIKQLNEDDKKA